MTVKKKPFENVGKGENAGSQHFLYFLQGYSIFAKISLNILFTLIFLSANDFRLASLKILSCGKRSVNCLKMPSIWTSLQYSCLLNSLPKDKILDMSEFKTFADEKLCCVKMKIFLFDGIENTFEKFSLFMPP